jgi:hypothetical protein
MSEYQVVLAYGGFAMLIFGFGVLWSRYRQSIKRRFHLLNYGPKGGDGQVTHPA